MKKVAPYASESLALYDRNITYKDYSKNQPLHSYIQYNCTG